MTFMVMNKIEVLILGIIYRVDIWGGEWVKALIVLDVQKGFVKNGKFNSELEKISALMDKFKEEEASVIATQHIDNHPDSIIYKDSEGAELVSFVNDKSDRVVKKHSPNTLSNMEIQELLTEKQIDHLVITGFNAEYCCLFTAITGADRGYKVTYIEDASGTVNSGETYDMESLDIVDFVGSILNWSGIVDVLYYDEYMESN